MADISILGCGWLGRPLAQRLIAEGHLVKGSTTRVERLQLLEDAGIRAFHIVTEPNAFSGDNADFLKADILILTVPPRRGNTGYLEKIKALFPSLKEAGIDRILFTSSISVYGNATGVITEQTVVSPDTATASEIVEVENALRKEFPLTTIVRLGGLTGPDRHPINSLAGRTEVPDGDAPINLVHLDDCIGAIEAILDHGLWGETFNIVPPYHSTKKDYYVQKASERGLPLPTFLPGGSNGRIIDGSRITTVGHYQYRVVNTI